jgi:hypothetical protein
MKILIRFAAISALCCSGLAQPADSLWSRMYGGTYVDLCTGVLETVDGGFILSGRTNYSPTDVDAWLVKTNSAGDVEWSRTLGGGQTEIANEVVLRPGGGYAMIGLTTSYGAGNEDVYFATVTAQGDAQSFNYWGGASYDVGHDLTPTTDGGFIIGGETRSFGSGWMDFYLIKANETGAEQWTQTFGGPEPDVCYAVQQVSDGYALAGYTTSYGAGEADAWLVRTNSAGQMLWSRTFGWGTNDVAYDMIATSDGGFALAGHTQSGGSGDRDFYLVKTDGNGTLQWNHTYGGQYDEFCNSVQQTSDGGYILTGSTSSFGSNGDIWLARVSSTGALLWSRTFGGSGAEDALTVDVISNGGFILGGMTTSFGAIDWDIWLVRTGPDPALGANDAPPALPTSTSLHVYPNPFNPVATISFDLPREVTGRLVVYDELGREAATLMNGRLSAGHHQMQLNGSAWSSGVYFVQLNAGEFQQTQKIVLMK